MGAKNRTRKTPRRKRRAKLQLGRVPDELRVAAQALTFWMGHRRAYYRFHQLTEGAIVAELCNALNANLPSAQRLECERLYKDLVSSLSPPDTRRVDLVVFEVPEPRDRYARSVPAARARCRYVVEVKRSPATPGTAQEDLKRLAMFRLANPGSRAFFLYASEYRAPFIGRTSLVTDKGRAISGPIRIGGYSAFGRVRMIARAGSAVAIASRGSESKEPFSRAFWAVVVEVLPQSSGRAVSRDRAISKG